MKRLFEYLPFLFLFIFLLTGCKREITDQDNRISNLSSEIWKVAGVAGQVIDEESKPVKGARVQFGNKSVDSDANGYFKFNQASFNTPNAFVSVKKPGYFNGSRAFIPRTGSNNYIKIQLLPSKIVGTVEAGNGGTITLSNQVSITFPANGFINATNASVSGKIKVSAAYINPTMPDFSIKMPGDLRGINSVNQQKLLRSFGIIAVELRTATGEILNLKKGFSATIKYISLPGLQSSRPASVLLWSFDESTGLWKEEGKVMNQGGGIYSGTVSHFSFWNVGEPQDFAKLSMRLIGDQGKPVQGIAVKLHNSYSDNYTYDFTDNLGFVDGYVPKETPILMQVIDNCQNVLLNEPIMPLTSDKDLGDIQLPGNLNLQTITGKVQDCNGEALKSGTLQVLLDDTHTQFTNIQNGSFSLTYSNCNKSNLVKLVAIDESNMQKSNAVPLALSSNNMDAGVINACGVNMPPYLDIYIDGIEQTWPNTIFGGWLDSLSTYGDNSNVITLFKGDTLNRGAGLIFNVKWFNPIHVPDSARMISITGYNSPVWYQAIDHKNFMVKFSLFGKVGKIMEGKFSGQFAKLYDCCPNSTVLDTVQINSSFRFRRDDPWWD